MEHKKILVCGAGGFIGYHLVKDLKSQGHYVIGADIKRPLYAPTDADEFYVYDLRNPKSGGTGHTMMMCDSQMVPYVDQKVWGKWI